MLNIEQRTFNFEQKQKTPHLLMKGFSKKGDEPTRHGGEHVVPIRNKKARSLEQAFH